MNPSATTKESGLRIFLLSLAMAALGLLALVVSLQSRQFRNECARSCAAKGQIDDGQFVLAPFVVPECGCHEPKPPRS
ncbi:MAG: hypothetical protein H6R14_1407 [Proteobacteria bacterium]|nr:hypothetical protein [Pseudomonadota bacterium]